MDAPKTRIDSQSVCSFINNFPSILRLHERSREQLAAFLLVVVAICAATTLHAQCPPLTGKPQTPGAEHNSSLGTPEFFDEPSFTVSAVTDTTNLGGHASGMAPPRATDALAQNVVSLGKQNAAAPASSTSTSAQERSLRDAVIAHPTDFEANRRLGQFLADSGKPAEAIPYLKRAHESNPADYETGYTLARALAGIGEYDSARATVSSLLAKEPNPPPQRKSAQSAELHHLLAELNEKLGHSLDAVREYQRAAELDPTEPNLFDWGAELLLHHASEPAIEVFAKGNHLFPDSSRMLVGSGVAWYSLGSYDHAAARLCEAADLNPKDPGPYPFLSKTLLADPANSQGILDRLARFVRLQPDNALGNYYYAVGLWTQGQASHDRDKFNQIESLLQKAVHLDPKLGAAYLQLGIIYAERGDSPKAIASYEEAVAATPEVPDAHYRLAQAYRQSGDAAKARQELQIFQRLSKQSEEEDERERRELQQFVFTRQADPPK
jgi:tetratricopeptide (TPR) repeat protein